jgi:UDP-N-acetylmuramoyl-L-alanyl-D-glutamate--2,6-diaminopimelate ligase
MQRVASLKVDAPMVVVDYAHTPDAVEKALMTLRNLAARRGGRLWCLLGCGGDRDAGKRPLMAAAAQAHADQVVLTSDNPRTESPQGILAGMLKGLRSTENVWVEVDRAVAIRTLVERADAKDVVLVAGKGHETYQEIQGVRHAFSDVEHVHAALLRRAADPCSSAQEVKA